MKIQHLRSKVITFTLFLGAGLVMVCFGYLSDDINIAQWGVARAHKETVTFILIEIAVSFFPEVFHEAINMSRLKHKKLQIGHRLSECEFS